MTKNAIQKEIDNIPSCIEELKQKIQQLETENNISSTSTSQKDVNTYLIKRCNHLILVLERKLRYLLLCLNNPESEKHNLNDALTFPFTSFRFAPRSFLVG